MINIDLKMIIVTIALIITSPYLLKIKDLTYGEISVDEFKKYCPEILLCIAGIVILFLWLGSEQSVNWPEK